MHAKIVVRDIRKSYATEKGPLTVLAGVDFAGADGEFVALVGPSGCGKTTLLNNIAGFERPDCGEVIVNGSPVTGPSRQGIVISQLGSVFPWLTVQQNLMFGLKGMPKNDKKRMAQHYIDLVGLKGFEQSFPYQISGGMLKRVELARALAVRSEILYMDEPFAALDALTRIRLRIELLQILSKERHTCLLVTHDVEEALHLADRIIILAPRPTKVDSIVEVQMAHPRRLPSSEIQQLKEEILQKLGVDTEMNDTFLGGSLSGAAWDSSYRPNEGNE
jgi:ABC-type nitrate/sulfonate/bicarbonate transport system ATPase subunit